MDARTWRKEVEQHLNDLFDRATSLITALDIMEADSEDLEDGADAEPSLGWGEGGPRACSHWPADGRSSPHDDRELECEDEGAQIDDEHSLGWQDEGGQERLGWAQDDKEPDLGSTEEMDQAKRLEVSPNWYADDGEPDLGWVESHGRGIVGEQNCLDDREHDDEREADDAENGIADADGLQWMSLATPFSRSPGVKIMNPSLSPDYYPEKFSIGTDGICCQPEIMDGQRVLVDKTRAYKRGDFVVIFRDPRSVAGGDHVMKVKRLVEDFPSSLLVATLNPPQLLGYDKRDVLGVWHCEPMSGGMRGEATTDGILLAEKARKLADGTIMRRFEPREEPGESMDLRAHYRAAKGH
jgi:hypothetical protein